MKNFIGCKRCGRRLHTIGEKKDFINSIHTQTKKEAIERATHICKRIQGEKKYYITKYIYNSYVLDFERDF